MRLVVCLERLTGYPGVAGDTSHRRGFGRLRGRLTGEPGHTRMHAKGWSCATPNVRRSVAVVGHKLCVCDGNMTDQAEGHRPYEG